MFLVAPVTSPLKIPNAQARAFWLATHGLGQAPTGPCDPMALIRDLGFVQLDSIQVVMRAHDHILWSRNQNYRPAHLDALLRDRQVFEHFTHDASVLPMESLPLWRRQFRRKHAQMSTAGWYKGLPDAEGRAAIKARIAAEGALRSHDFDTKVEGPKQMWSRPPHKLALDFMWYSGELATCHREGFTKVYDLAERVFPADLWAQDVPDGEQIDGLCRMALSRLGFATLGEVQRFWDAVSRDEVQAWADGQNDLCEVAVQGADGSWTKALALPDLEARLKQLGPPTSRLRILNPFDPAIRDRARLSRLFGFDYRVEMFVPAAKRQWGYYVFPLIESGRFVGRVDLKANRKSGQLEVLGFWPEPGSRWGAKRLGKLQAELSRLARFAGVSAEKAVLRL